ncbi:MAG TPA: diguanylate cyclase [Dehalococcoidia bacterium]|nr:diguanylate cyclase [Dehalococcoidia bacterium]
MRHSLDPNNRASLAFLITNLAIAVSMVWLSQYQLEARLAIALILNVVIIEVGLWYVMLRVQRPQHEPRIVSVMERSAQARRFSIRDEATGLLNRWYLERRLNEEAARCKRYGYSMAVVVLKAAVPNLSGISIDGWQEQSADAAQRCLTVIRNVDLSALLGPFEFAICLVQCDRVAATEAIHRLVGELTEYQCSAGLAILPDDDCEPSAMIELARMRSQPYGTATPGVPIPDSQAA